MENLKSRITTTHEMAGEDMSYPEGCNRKETEEHHHLLPRPRCTISNSELEGLVLAQHCMLKIALLQFKVDAAMTRLYCIRTLDVQASSDLNYICEYV